MNSNRKKVFLHFMNRDARDAWGVSASLTIEKQHEFMRAALSVAILLSGDCCFCPVAFAFECDIARRVLREFEVARELGYIQYSLREREIAEYIQKKQREYGTHPTRYPGYFRSDRSANAIVRHVSAPIMERHELVGDTMRTRWFDDLEKDKTKRIWHPVLKADRRDQLRKRLLTVPNITLEQKRGFIWPLVRDQFSPSEDIPRNQIRGAVLHYYYSVYTRLYDAVVLSGLPHASTDFGLARYSSVLYDYTAFMVTLRFLDAWFLLLVLF